jgi:hypothetical protein
VSRRTPGTPDMVRGRPDRGLGASE